MERGALNELPRLVFCKERAHGVSRLTAMASGSSVSWRPRFAWVALHFRTSKWVGGKEDRGEDQESQKWTGERQRRSKREGRDWDQWGRGEQSV